MEEHRLAEYIRSYQDLLNEKGYNEETLGEESLTGTIGSNLEQAFREANRNTADAEAIEIQMRILGIIGTERKLIGFQFVFVLNPGKETIMLRNIDAYNGDTLAVIVPPASGIIPSSQEVYDTLKKQQAPGVAIDVIKTHTLKRKGHGLN